MPEPGGHAETVRAGAPIRIGSVTLLAIERVVVRADLGARHAWCSAAKEPYALIVRDARGVRAVDADGRTVSLDDLLERVPGLDASLAST